MLIDYTGKLAVVTGGSKGLGYVTARKFLESGARVAIIASNAERVETAEKTLSEFGEVKGYVYNLEDAAGISELVDRIVADMGNIDVLVQCAALMGVGKILTPENWDRSMNINAKSFYFMMKAVTDKCMIPQRSGAIVNISSMAGVRGMCPPICNPIYSATKGAVCALTMQAAVQWGEYNIRVNCIAPGGLVPDDCGDARRANLGNYIPLPQDAKQTDIANFALYLCSDINRAQTGTITIVDAGAHAVGY